MDAKHLLIDAKNAIYRAVYAVKADTRHENKYHYFVVLLRQITSWMNTLRPESVHVFWDVPRATVWRRKVLATYKDRENNPYIEDISEDLIATSMIAKEFFACMNVRQYERREMEADDMIYAAVSVLHPNNSVIVSTDSDMIQIPYTYSSCSVYHPKNAECVAVPAINPVWQKALMGDKGDNIPGYKGIGPKKSAIILTAAGEFERFLETVDRKIYYRNLLLIDLSANPRILDNKIYFQKHYQRPVTFDDTKIRELVATHRVNGMLAEYQNLVPQFRELK